MDDLPDRHPCFQAFLGVTVGLSAEAKAKMTDVSTALDMTVCIMVGRHDSLHSGCLA